MKNESKVALRRKIAGQSIVVGGVVPGGSPRIGHSAVGDQRREPKRSAIPVEKNL